METMNQASFAAAASPLAQELFDRQFSANARRTDRMFAVLMILQWAGAVVAALLLSPKTWDRAPATRTRTFGWRYSSAGPWPRCRCCWPGSYRPPAHAERHCRGPGDVLVAADSRQRRPDRNPLPRLRIAGVPGVLSRLDGAGAGHAGRGRRSLCPRSVLARNRVRNHHARRLAVARTCRLGHLRGHIPDNFLPLWSAGDASERLANRGVGADERRHATAGR